MKKITACIIIMVFLLGACSPQKETGMVSQPSKSPNVSEALDEEKSVEVSGTGTSDSIQTELSGDYEEQETIIGKKISPLFSGTIDISKKGGGNVIRTGIFHRDDKG